MAREYLVNIGVRSEDCSVAGDRWAMAQEGRRRADLKYCKLQRRSVVRYGLMAMSPTCPPQRSSSLLSRPKAAVMQQHHRDGPD